MKRGDSGCPCPPPRLGGPGGCGTKSTGCSVPRIACLLGKGSNDLLHPHVNCEKVRQRTIDSWGVSRHCLKHIRNLQVLSAWCRKECSTSHSPKSTGVSETAGSPSRILRVVNEVRGKMTVEVIPSPTLLAGLRLNPVPNCLATSGIGRITPKRRSICTS